MRALQHPALRTLALLASLTLAACGGDDDGDGGGDGDGTADAAPGGGADAGAPDAAPGAVMGEACDPANPDCPEAYPDCIAFEQGGPGYCTKTCGSGGGTPPEGGDEICEDGYTGDATAACLVSVQPQGGPQTWYCGLACGMAGRTDFGTCPEDLTCDDEDPKDLMSGLCKP